MIAKEKAIPRDALARPLHDLRISVTDRCNLRCVYCMPKEVFGPDYPYLARNELLMYEEITRLTRVLTGLGVRKVRLTGGEPLLRHDVESLVEMLARIPELDLTMTTNGALLTLDKARALKAAGRLRAIGCDVVACICIVDREEGGKDAFEAAGIPLLALSTLSDYA